jgi:hypothetical protein
MTSISGTIRIGEATPTVKSTAKRQRGGVWPFYLLMFALWLGGAVGGWAIGRLVHFDAILAGCAGAVIGILFFYRPLLRGLAIRRFRKTLTSKGVPLDMPVRLEIAPETFAYEIADVRMSAKWSAVSEVFHAKGWWIFMVQSDPWFAADRFFASDAEARVFLGEALSHMSEAARARSGDAVKFVGTAS